MASNHPYAMIRNRQEQEKLDKRVKGKQRLTFVVTIIYFVDVFILVFDEKNILEQSTTLTLTLYS